MGLWDRLRGGSPVDHVALTTPLADDAVATPFPEGRIKHGATLVVPEGLVAVVVLNGKATDTLSPGTHALDVAHLPRLAAAKGIAASDASFRARVYFVRVKRFSEQSWATHAAIVSRDPEFGTVRAQANGTFGFVVTQPAAFLNHMRPADDQPSELKVQLLHNLVVSQFSEAVRTGELTASDLLGPLGRLGLVAGEQLARQLDAAGVTLTRFKVAKVSVPADVRRPTGGAGPGGADGYTAMFSERVHRTASHPTAAPLAPVNPARAAAAAKVATELASLLDDVDTAPRQPPQSHRIPLADAPEGVFGTRAPGPVSERLELPPSGPESAYNPGPTTWRSPPSGSGAPPAPHHDQPNGPPPLPAFIQFHVEVGGAPAGPFDILTLSSKVREGSLRRSTLVWRPGMDGWVAAETVEELSQMFGPEPPPLPAL